MPTFEDGRVKKSKEVLNILKKHFSDVLCKPIKYNSKVSESAGHGKTIFEFDPKSKGAEDYQNLVTRIIKDEKEYA